MNAYLPPNFSILGTNFSWNSCIVHCIDYRTDDWKLEFNSSNAIFLPVKGPVKHFMSSEMPTSENMDVDKVCYWQVVRQGNLYFYRYFTVRKTKICIFYTCCRLVHKSLKSLSIWKFIISLFFRASFDLFSILSFDFLSQPHTKLPSCIKSQE